MQHISVRNVQELQHNTMCPASVNKHRLMTIFFFVWKKEKCSDSCDSFAVSSQSRQMLEIPTVARLESGKAGNETSKDSYIYLGEFMSICKAVNGFF